MCKHKELTRIKKEMDYILLGMRMGQRVVNGLIKMEF